MDVTKMINKLRTDYSKIGAVSSDTIKYMLEYNGYSIGVFYSATPALRKTLRLVIDDGVKKYLLVEYFTEDNNTYNMCTYVDPEIYSALKFTVFYKDGKCKTTPLFEAIEKAILVKEPIKSGKPGNGYVHKSSTYNPFSETTVRTKMSDEMRERIKRNYAPALARKILAYCGDTHTLRFTSDEEKARDIEAYLDTH